MSDRRVFRWATTSTRIALGTVVAAASVVAVVSGVSLPWPTVARDALSIVATPAPAATVLSCDGGLLVLGGDLENPGALQAVAPQTVTAGVQAGAPEPATTRLEAADVTGEDAPTSYTALPTNDARTDLAASGSATATGEALAGFAASACRPPLMESWLVAGSGATGAADLVVLGNPGPVAATVDLTVFGATGALNPPGGSAVVVPAGAQRVVALAGLARGEASPVIRINSVGAPVQASLQSSVTRVLEPGGVDQAGAVSSTEMAQRILGITVAEDSDDAVTGSPSTLVRVLSPVAAAEATVTVNEIGGGEARAPITVPLAAGIPTEVALNDLSAGEYVVDVTASEPVAASVRHATGEGEGSDFAWHLPSPEIAVPTLFAVPGGPAASLALLNPGDAPATVTVSGVDGADPVEIVLAPGQSSSVPVGRREVFALDSAGTPVLAAVTMNGGSGLAAFPVWPADAAAGAVRIYP